MNLVNFLQALRNSGFQYAFYLRRQNLPPCFEANNERFSAASLIKVPILLAWLAWNARERSVGRSGATWMKNPRFKGQGLPGR